MPGHFLVPVLVLAGLRAWNPGLYRLRNSYRASRRFLAHDLALFSIPRAFIGDSCRARGLMLDQARFLPPDFSLENLSVGAGAEKSHRNCDQRSPLILD